jgi:gliding motility-associated-like protein
MMGGIIFKYKSFKKGLHKLKTFFIISIMILAGIFRTTNVMAQAVNVTDSLTLVSIYNNTGGPNWFNHTGWLIGPVVNWFGVTLMNNKVDDLALDGNNLTGSLPNSIGNFTAIEGMELGDNKLTGSIPTSIGNLKILRSLTLENNLLTGTIPSSIGTIPTLSDIYFKINKLNGTIPASIGNLASLANLDLSYNKLTGTIPTTFNNLTKLDQLILSGNQLSGTIPGGIGNFVFISNLQLNSNLLTGPIPTNLTNLLGLNTFRLDSNKFDFTGMEELALAFPEILNYEPQDTLLPIHVGNNGLSVNAGGTLANNTYNWYKNGILDVIKTGDSTYLPTNSCGPFYVVVSNAVLENFYLTSQTFLFTVADSIGISASANNICAGTSVIFTATTNNKLSSKLKSYQWFLNGKNVGVNSSTYTNNTLANKDVITCVLTSTYPCVNPTTYTSNKITMQVNQSITPSFTDIGSRCQYSKPPDLLLKSNEGIIGTWYPATIDMSTPGTSGYIFTPTDSTSCYRSDTMNITIIPTPNAPVVTTNSPICAGMPLIINTTSTGGGFIYNMGTFNPPKQINFLGQTDTIPGANASDSGKWFIVGENDNGCISDTGYFNVTIHSPSKPTMTSNSPVCAEDNLVLRVPFVPGIKYFIESQNGLYTSDGYFVDSTSVFNNVSVNYGGPWIASSRDPLGCVSPFDTITVVINPKLIDSISIAASVNNICKGTPVNFTATSINGGTTPVYQWLLNGVPAGTNSTSYSNNNLAGNDVINCILTSNAVCVSSAKDTSNKIVMVVNPFQIPTFKIPPSCQFSIAPKLPDSSIEEIPGTWNPATINTTAPGTFNYIFTPANGQCAKIDTIAVVINAQIAPTFNIKSTYCQNAVADSLPTVSNEGLKGTWNPAEISTTAVGTFNYIFTPTPGQCAKSDTLVVKITNQITLTFDPILPVCQNTTAPKLPPQSKELIAGSWNPATIDTATVGTSNYIFTPTAGGNCYLPGTLSVTITAQVTPTFDAIPPVCQNTTAPPLLLASKEPISGTWNPATINTTAPGTFNYIFTPANGQCAKIDTIAVVINPQIAPTFNIKSTYCQNAVADSLPTVSKEGLKGIWNPAEISTTAVGTFNYIFTPTPGQCAKSDTLVVKITNQITLTFDPIPPICQNTTAPPLPPQSKELIAGTWNPATIDTATVGTSNYVFTPTAGGPCIAPATVSVTITTQLTPTFDAIPPVCQNTTAPPLPPQSKELIAGTWSPAAVSTTLVGAMDYIFTPTGNPCAATGKLTVVVNPLPLVNAGPDKTINTGESINLTPVITGVTEGDISSYLWSPSDGLSNPAIASPVASPSVTTIYKLDVNSKAGCDGNGSVTITVIKTNLPPIHVPNAFSPNGDGINDTWVIENISYYPGATLDLFNRYGQRLLHSEGYGKAWDGTFNGNPVPVATYYYVLDPKNNMPKMTGSVTVFR